MKQSETQPLCVPAGAGPDAMGTEASVRERQPFVLGPRPVAQCLPLTPRGACGPGLWVPTRGAQVLVLPAAPAIRDVPWESWGRSRHAGSAVTPLWLGPCAVWWVTGRPACPAAVPGMAAWILGVRGEATPPQAPELRLPHDSVPSDSGLLRGQCGGSWPEGLGCRKGHPGISLRGAGRCGSPCSVRASVLGPSRTGTSRPPRAGPAVWLRR